MHHYGSHMPRTAAVAVLFALTAPAAAAPDLSPRDRGDLAIRARAVLRQYCADCHGEKPRRGDVSVLNHEKLAAPAYPVPLVNPADPPRSLLLQLVRDGSMPPGGRPGPTSEQVKTLADWVAAGAPGYPAAFGDGYAAAASHADWLASHFYADKPFQRYLSFAHLVRDDAPPPDLHDPETKLRAAVRAATGRDGKLVPIDPTATVFKLDLRSVGWDRGNLFDRVNKFGAREDAHALTGLDTVMLEYPHAAAAAWPVETAKLVPKLSGVRPVPVVRADWLAAALAPNAPLTADVRALSELAPDKEPCGPRPGRFFAGPADPGRPPDAWLTGDPAGGPFKLTAEVVTGPEFNAPAAEVREGEKHKLRVTSDRPVRVRVLRVLSIGKTTDQVIERNAIPAGATLLGPRTNAPFAASVSGGDAATDYYVVFAAEVDVPAPTVLKSRHREDCEDRSRLPVWRFVFDATDPAFDPARVVRRVVPLTVRKP